MFERGVTGNKHFVMKRSALPYARLEDPVSPWGNELNGRLLSQV